VVVVVVNGEACKFVGAEKEKTIEYQTVGSRSWLVKRTSTWIHKHKLVDSIHTLVNTACPLLSHLVTPIPPPI